MNNLLILYAVLSLLTTFLFIFPGYILAKFGYKEKYHKDDYDLDDLRWFYLIVGVLMIASYILLFHELSTIVLG